MTIPLIIAICILLLLGYVFDITSSKTRIPSVILLLILGWTVKQIATFIAIPVPDLTPILPVLGTIGLILIVLEGSLELELNKSKFAFVGMTTIISLLPMLILSFTLGYAFQYFGHTSFKVGLANAIPFAIISSAIAIPSVKNIRAKNKAFITYESSLSDIFGVIFFNFITLNNNIGSHTVGHFMVDLLIILVVTFIATIALAVLLSKIKHHVKFAPIILMLVLIYCISKLFHLPALIFILLFGLFLGNLDEIKHNKFILKLKPEILNREVHKFKELTIELAFLIRSLFFLVFGYLIQTAELLNTSTIIWAVGIIGSIFFVRYVFLKLFRLDTNPLLFIAPRGLITILLFLSVPPHLTTDLSNNSLIIQVIILTALIMMIGLMVNKSVKKMPPLPVPEPQPEEGFTFVDTPLPTEEPLTP
jgi:potassium/hydrogen antiporter